MEMLLVAFAVEALNVLVFFWPRGWLLASNLVLRQQLALYKRKRPRPVFRDGDRLFSSGTETQTAFEICQLHRTNSP